MTPAQIYALAFGATLLLVGIVGFAVNSNFDTGDGVSTGDKLIVFELNGWHNLVHIASGLLGLLLFRRNDTARLFALGFGAVYLIVTIIGFADGTDVLGLIPVNGADNVLHLLIAAAGLAAGLMSPDDSRGRVARA
jgi:hypothetical protein